MIDLTQFWKDHPEYDGLYKEYAVYPLVWNPLAANAVQQQSDTTVGMDADFVATNLYGTQTTAVTNAAFIATPLIMGLIYTGAGTRNVTNVKVEWTSVVGTAGNPRVYWPYPILIPKATQFSAQMDNPQAVASNVWLSIHGVKIFY